MSCTVLGTHKTTLKVYVLEELTLVYEAFVCAINLFKNTQYLIFSDLFTSQTYGCQEILSSKFGRIINCKVLECQICFFKCEEVFKIIQSNKKFTVTKATFASLVKSLHNLK